MSWKISDGSKSFFIFIESVNFWQKFLIVTWKCNNTHKLKVIKLLCGAEGAIILYFKHDVCSDFYILSLQYYVSFALIFPPYSWKILGQAPLTLSQMQILIRWPRSHCKKITREPLALIYTFWQKDRSNSTFSTA